jgi:exoribonuclease R
LLEDIIRAGDKRRAGRRRQSGDDLAALGREASAAERRAQQAQREAVERLLLELMKSKLGAVLDGVVTGVMSFGVFVQVRPYLAEGVIRVADFGADEWRYDRAKGVFIGRRSGRTIHIGQAIRVQVAAADEVRQELLLQPVGDIGSRVAGQAVRPGRPKVVRRQRRQGRRGRR